MSLPRLPPQDIGAEIFHLYRVAYVPVGAGARWELAIGFSPRADEGSGDPDALGLLRATSAIENPGLDDCHTCLTVGFQRDSSRERSATGTINP